MGAGRPRSAGHQRVAAAARPRHCAGQRRAPVLGRPRPVPAGCSRRWSASTRPCPPSTCSRRSPTSSTPKSQDAITENYRVHEFLVHGYRGVSYVDADGTEQTPTIHLLADRAGDNEFLAVNQVTVRHKDHERRFDVVLYVNGLPLAVIELKQAGAAKADVAAAHAQLQTYLRELPMAFRFCVLVVASDGLFAKYGTPFTPLHHFSPWNVDADGRPVELGHPEGDDYLGTGLELLIDGVFNIERFLQLLRDFTAYDAERRRPGQADRQAAPVLRGDQGGRQHHRGGAQQRQGRGGLAHPGLRQVHGDGAVRRAGDAPPAAAQPDGRRHHRPQRAGRAALPVVQAQPAAAGAAHPDHHALRASPTS